MRAGLRRAKLVLLGLLILGVSFFGIVFVLYYWGAGSQLAPGFSKERLLSLRPGMTEEEVFKRMGPPLKKDLWNMVLLYGVTNIVDGGYEIGVLVREGHVKRVYIERHDLGIYWFDENGSPTIQDQRLLDQLPN